MKQFTNWLKAVLCLGGNYVGAILQRESFKDFLARMLQIVVICIVLDLFENDDLLRNADEILRMIVGS